MFEVSLAALVWVLLWAGINTGPWNLRLNYIEQSWGGVFNGVRAALPLVVLAIWFFHVLIRRRRAPRSAPWPEALWLYYGIVATLSSLYAEPWFDYTYWGFAYLGVFAAVEMYMSEGPALERAATLNRLNWLLGGAVLTIVVWVARGQLLVETPMGISGYGVVNRVGTVAGMPMVRSSGLSRFAAMPAIVAFVALWYSRGWKRVPWIAVLVPSLYLVWVMQSRGSLVSLLFALSFVMVWFGGRARITGVVMALLLVTVFIMGFIPGDTVHRIYMYATRGTQGRQLASMSGRTAIFHRAWQAIRERPLLGYGFQADRQIATIGNAQNGILYALLCGGFIGGFGYIAGLAATWVMMLRALRHRYKLNRAHRMTLIQVAGIVAFFTIRNYPENSTALYSVDLLLMLPAVVYIGELDRAAKHIRRVPRHVTVRSVSRSQELETDGGIAAAVHVQPAH